MSDKELTEYLEDSDSSPNRVEHAVGAESTSATVKPPTAGGNNPALDCNPTKVSYESTPTIMQVPLATEPAFPPNPSLSYAQCVSKGGKAPPPLPPQGVDGSDPTPAFLG